MNEGEPDLILADDIGKIKTLLTKLCLAGFNAHILDQCSINRIGKQRSNYKRLIKVVLPTVALRNVILDNAKKLKTFTDLWKYIYIKKDLHPVYLKENKRIYKKLYDMKQNPDNADKEIKVVKGKLLVDGNIVDKNTFFA